MQFTPVNSLLNGLEEATRFPTQSFLQDYEIPAGASQMVARVEWDNLNNKHLLAYGTFTENSQI